IWIDLAKLQELKDLPGAASIIVLSSKASSEFSRSEDWNYMSPRDLLADLYKVMETETGQQNIMFALLLFLAMIAIFDTQILALFKRRREIGTLSALGMPKGKIITLFTLEGVLYMVFSIFFTAVLGFPVFWYFARYGYRMPDGFDSFGMAGMSDTIRFQYPARIIIGTIAFVFVLTAIVSWIPSARIAKMNPTDALRGKVN
ncbi:MAG: FtsX-like permease family protein, partial [Candidatus Cloacimonadaceae bacterium]|nr:FtsX-like permease family protein [Candidatus Cloacimonadaceae bacterium]